MDYVAKVCRPPKRNRIDIVRERISLRARREAGSTEYRVVVVEAFAVTFSPKFRNVLENSDGISNDLDT